MSERAIVWASDQIAPCGRSKQVLMRLAAYAIDGGETWAAVTTLAEEIQASERQVQRLLRKLEIAGFIRSTGRYRYRNIPYYQLDLGRVGELALRRAERLASRKVAANGDTDVTVEPKTEAPNGDMDVTVDAANGDIRDANGDMGVTRRERREEESADALSARARAEVARVDGAKVDWTAFEVVETLWTAKAPDRVAPPVDRRCWVKALGKLGSAELAAAAQRYLEESPDVQRGRCKALAVWLAEERWVGWLGERPAPPELASPAGVAAPRWPGPAEVRTAFVARLGEGWAASWLDRCGWSEAERAILTPTRIGAERVAAEVRRLEIAGVAEVRHEPQPEPGKVAAE